MLTAVVRGKAGSVKIKGEEYAWRDLFSQSHSREDLITACFFSRFRFLTKQSRQNALALLVDTPENPIADTLGDIQKIDFWQKFTHEGRRVEPDVVIRCEDAVLLIEVKHPLSESSQKQNQDQWERELFSCVNSYINENDKKIYFIALGGNETLYSRVQDIEREIQSKINAQRVDCTISIHTREWEDIYAAIMQNDQWTGAKEPCDKAVIDDWKELFALYDIAPPALSLRDFLNQLEQDKLLTMNDELIATVESLTSKKLGSKMDINDQNLKQRIESVVEQQRIAHKLLAVFYKQMLSYFDEISSKHHFKFYYWLPTYEIQMPYYNRRPHVDEIRIRECLPIYCSQFVYTKQLPNNRHAGLNIKLNCDERFRPENRNNAQYNPISTIEIGLYLFDGTSNRDEWYETWEGLDFIQPSSKEQADSENKIHGWYPNPHHNIWYLRFEMTDFLEAFSDDGKNIVHEKIAKMLSDANIEPKHE